jgi:hypothetical protein
MNRVAKYYELNKQEQRFLLGECDCCGFAGSPPKEEMFTRAELEHMLDEVGRAKENEGFERGRNSALAEQRIEWFISVAGYGFVAFCVVAAAMAVWKA